MTEEQQPDRGSARLAISNIAWPHEQLREMLPVIAAAGCCGLEIAPSRLAPDPLQLAAAELRAFRRLVRDHGLEVVSLHSLLHPRPELGLFRGREVARQTADYLRGLIALAGELGAAVLVFGSPQCRNRGELPLAAAMEEAATFFRGLAPAAAAVGAALVIEPLTPEETNFITTAAEGQKLVTMVGHPGFQLHLDAKSLAREPGPPDQVLAAVLPMLRHFHINDPGLVEIGSTADYHARLGAALQASGYDRYASIEMKTLPDYRAAVGRSLIVARRHYCPDPDRDRERQQP